MIESFSAKLTQSIAYFRSYQSCQNANPGYAWSIVVCGRSAPAGQQPRCGRVPGCALYPLSPRADLGCGIGADTLALAEAGLDVIAVEHDPVRARLAELNVAACGLAEHVRVICADWTTLALDVDAAFADPARRMDGRYGFRLAAMIPPLSAILTVRERVPDVAVKVMPGVDHVEIPAEAELDFISELGEMKEAVLLFGDTRAGAARRATLLPGPHHLDSTMPSSDAVLSAPRRYLNKPDPAILRATLVKTLATQLCAAQLDADIAYLTSDTPVETPFARRWTIVQHWPFNLKVLNRWLRGSGAGDVVVKKRGSPIDPDAFRRRLKTTPGSPTLTVFLTHVQEKPWVILANQGSDSPASVSHHPEGVDKRT